MSTPRAGLSLESRRFRQYLMFAVPVNVPAFFAIGLLYTRFPSPLLAVLTAGILLNMALGVASLRRANADRVSASVVYHCAGIWALSLVLSLGGSATYPVVPALNLVPLVAVGPYVRTATLMRLCLIAFGLTLAATGFVAFGAPLAAHGIPPDQVSVVVWVGLPIIVGLVAIAAWHSRETLEVASERREEAVLALQESERTLEGRVHERTRELEESEQELARARDEALAANQHKSAFLANMSHELRTPLNAVIGFSEVLSEKYFGELTDKQSEYVTDIHQSGHHLLSLINDILDLSKIEAGRLELAPSEFHLAATCENALSLMRERALRAELTVVEEVDEDVGSIVADERKVKQILINLLTNAVKFSEPGGTVTLRARNVGEDVELSVVDTGVGIAAADQQLVFEEFRQVENDYTRKQEGTGLGLALCKRLVELHGGRISLTSAPGEGSTFTFTIPRSVQS